MTMHGQNHIKFELLLFVTVAHFTAALLCVECFFSITVNVVMRVKLI